MATGPTLPHQKEKRERRHNRPHETPAKIHEITKKNKRNTRTSPKQHTRQPGAENTPRPPKHVRRKGNTQPKQTGKNTTNGHKKRLEIRKTVEQNPEKTSPQPTRQKRSEKRPKRHEICQTECTVNRPRGKKRRTKCHKQRQNATQNSTDSTKTAVQFNNNNTNKQPSNSQYF